MKERDDDGVKKNNDLGLLVLLSFTLGCGFVLGCAVSMYPHISDVPVDPLVFTLDDIIDREVVIREQNETINGLIVDRDKWQYMFNDCWDKLHDCVEGD